MADIVITIPNAQVSRVLNAFATKFHYEENVWINEEFVANPVTKAQFAKSKVIDYIKQVVLQVERDEVRRIAEETNISPLDAE